MNPELQCLSFAVPKQSSFSPYFILKNPCCLCHCQLAVLLYPLFLSCSIPYYFYMLGIVSFFLPMGRYFLLSFDPGGALWALYLKKVLMISLEC